MFPFLQLNIYFGSFFIVALSGGEWYGWTAVWVGSVGFSGFFTYEVCRKLDPSLPRVSELGGRFKKRLSGVCKLAMLIQNSRLCVRKSTKKRDLEGECVQGVGQPPKPYRVPKQIKRICGLRWSKDPACLTNMHSYRYMQKPRINRLFI